jgi:hypothetical protein
MIWCNTQRLFQTAETERETFFFFQNFPCYWLCWMDFMAISTQCFLRTARNGPPDPSAAFSLIPGHPALLCSQMQRVFREHVYPLWDRIFTLKIFMQLSPKIFLNCGHKFCGMELECADHCLGMSQCFTAWSAATQVLLPGV